MLTKWAIIRGVKNIENKIFTELHKLEMGTEDTQNPVSFLSAILQRIYEIMGNIFQLFA